MDYFVHKVDHDGWFAKLVAINLSIPICMHLGNFTLLLLPSKDSLYFHFPMNLG